MNYKSFFHIGTASWAIPKEFRARFLEAPSILEKYALKFNAVEINSSFYRDHQAKTYAKWAEMTPATFRFSVKLSRFYTHQEKLRDTNGLFEVLAGIMKLGEKLGVLLIQLPPKLEYEEKVADHFFKCLRKIYAGPIALEARHPSWISDLAVASTQRFLLQPVMTDPMAIEARPIAQSSLRYYRLHGSPIIYRSNYESEALANWAKRLSVESKAGAKDIWCIFDNTTFGCATLNALEMMSLLNLY